MRLHVGEGAAEQLLGAVDGQLLQGVGEFGAAIVAPAGIALDGLVDHHRPQRVQTGEADQILRRNQFDLVLLAGEFTGNGAIDFRVGIPEMGGEIGIRVGHENHQKVLKKPLGHRTLTRQDAA